MKKIASLTSLALFPLAAPAALLFDIDGPGDLYEPRELRAFDWAVGESLAQGVVLEPPGTPFRTLAQFELSDVLFSDGTEPLPIGSDGPFEITTVITIDSVVQARTDTFIVYTFLGGDVDIYYDDLSGPASDNADNLNTNNGNLFGAFGNGELILSAEIQPMLIGANFTRSPDVGLETLDQFGADDLGVDTILGFGAANFTGEVDFSNPAWFPDEDADLTMTITTFETPFASSEPSGNGGIVVDRAPDYGGGPNGVIQGSDFHSESDANTDFRERQIPEPKPLVLLAAGLLGLFLWKRNHGNNNKTRRNRVNA